MLFVPFTQRNVVDSSMDNLVIATRVMKSFLVSELQAELKEFHMSGNSSKRVGLWVSL